MEVNEQLGLADVRLSATRLVFVFEEGEDGLASREVRVGGGETEG